MGRHQICRKTRKYRRKILLSFLLFFFLLFAGVLTADISVRSLIGNEGSAAIAALKKNGGSFEICFMNRTFRINAEYLIRDYARIKRIISDVAGRQE